MWKHRRHPGKRSFHIDVSGENDAPPAKGNERCLLDLEPGQKAEICKICCRGPIRHRIMDMGLVPGAEVELVRYAPMGDPVVIRVCNYLLSLRKSEACGILL